MSILKNSYRLLKKFVTRLSKDNIGAFAAQSAFFFILSIFPLFMLILSIMKYTPLTTEHLIKFFNELLPSALANSFNNVINETYAKSNIGLISFATATTLWTASKGVASITFGFENVYGDEKDKRSYFVVRLLSSLYTVIFIFAFVLSLSLLVFGNSLIGFFSSRSSVMYAISTRLIEHRSLLVPIALILIFCGIYNISSPKKTKFFMQIPGALFSTFGWISFSYLFSFYVDNFDRYSYLYGSITTIILLMVWFYICIYILFLGVEINIFFRHFFSKAQKKAVDKISRG